MKQIKKRSINIKKFQNDDKCRFFVGTTHTGGYGITLTAGSTMIYFSNGYDLEKRQQSEARIDRIGQTKPMTYIDIISEDTVDDRIVKALRNKVNIANEIMGEDLKTGFNLYQKSYLLMVYCFLNEYTTYHFQV